MRPGRLYDRIGAGYRRRRHPDPRIAAAIAGALGDARAVVNVGAGTGSYEPTGRRVVAVEPSVTMISQRAPEAPPVVRALAGALPFPDRSFDAALAVLTLHHWPDAAAGARELARVARDRVVVLTWDPETAGFWLADYFPEIVAIDRRNFPRREALVRAVEQARPEWRTAASPVAIPADCADGFLGAYWARPERYLDPEVRAGMSTFGRIDAAAGLERLRADLESGAWRERYGDGTGGTPPVAGGADLGYRLLVAAAAPSV